VEDIIWKSSSIVVHHRVCVPIYLCACSFSVWLLMMYDLTSAARRISDCVSCFCVQIMLAYTDPIIACFLSWLNCRSDCSKVQFVCNRVCVPIYLCACSFSVWLLMIYDLTSAAHRISECVSCFCVQIMLAYTDPIIACFLSWLNCRSDCSKVQFARCL